MFSHWWLVAEETEVFKDVAAVSHVFFHYNKVLSWIFIIVHANHCIIAFCGSKYVYFKLYLLVVHLNLCMLF